MHAETYHLAGMACVLAANACASSEAWAQAHQRSYIAYANSMREWCQFLAQLATDRYASWTTSGDVANP
jgi:hypothetical protein